MAECFCLIVFHYENDNVAMGSRITRMGYEYRKLGHNKKVCRLLCKNTGYTIINHIYYFKKAILDMTLQSKAIIF